jgi:ATP synthase subunit 6
MIFSPLEQFSIFQKFAFFIQMKLLGFSLYFDFSLTIFLIENLNNFLVFFSLIGIYLFVLENLISKTNTIFATLYNFLYSIMQQQIKEDKYLSKYFILICTIFLFILVNNLFGMIPYSFVSTAQLGQNFFLSSSLIIFFTILGFFYLKEAFLNIFVPSAPKAMLPFLVIIELISYIARAFSLAIRLFANLMSGHTLLFILCAFNSVILTSNFFGFVIASVIILLIFGLELVIAFMQAYVFTVLASVYLKDSTAEAHH